MSTNARRAWHRALAVLIIAAMGARLPVHAGAPIRIGSRLEPFVDGFLIDKLAGAELTLHRPTPREIVLVHDKPWEAGAPVYHTVFQDGDIYRMYYGSARWGEPQRKDARPPAVCCAESKDGIHWTRPKLGLFGFEGSKQNNIVWMGVGAGNFAPFRDTNPKCKPDARYKALGSAGEWKLHAFKSPDAIHWSRMSDQPVLNDGEFDSLNVAFWDTERGEYRAYCCKWARGSHGGGKNKRGIWTTASKDFLRWPDGTYIEGAGSQAWQLETSQVAPYHRAPHVFVGLPMRTVTVWGPRGRPPRRSSDGLFMTSRDGRRFQRWAEAIIRPGPRKARWHPRNNMTAWGIVVTRSALAGTPDELSIYAAEGHDRGKACRLRRYTVRIDGFVSVQAPMRGGELTTKPLVFAAPEKLAPRPRPRPAAGPVARDAAKPLVGKRSLVFKEPTYVTLPGTKQLGAKVTFAAHVRGVPAGHRRLFSTYDGGSTVPKELFLDFDSDADLGDGSAIRFGYDKTMVKAPSKEVAKWNAGPGARSVHHIAATWNDGIVTIYFDGKQAARGGQPGRGAIASRRGDVRFGEDYPPTSLTNEPFLGTVDDLLVLRRVLGPDEVKALAQKGAAAVLRLETDNGVLYTMEADEGTTLTDHLPHDGAQNAALPLPGPPGEVELILNYSTSAAGSIRCEIRDAAGKPIAGYSLSECDEIFGDHVERAVTWRRRSELKELAARPVRLRVVLKDADLYSIRFGRRTPAAGEASQ